MRRFRADEKIRVEIDGRLHRARAVHADGDGGRMLASQESIHVQRDGNIRIVGQKYLAQRNRLQGLRRNVAKHVRRVQPYLHAIRCRKHATARPAVMSEDVVQRRLQVGVAEPLCDYAEDVRDTGADGLGPIDPYDRADADRRTHRSPEVKFVRCVGLALGGNDATDRFAREVFRQFIRSVTHR